MCSDSYVREETQIGLQTHEYVSVFFVLLLLSIHIPSNHQRCSTSPEKTPQHKTVYADKYTSSVIKIVKSLHTMKPGKKLCSDCTSSLNVSQKNSMQRKTGYLSRLTKTTYHQNLLTKRLYLTYECIRNYGKT